MATVQVIQRHAHLASAVHLEFVAGREGQVARAVLTAISNMRRGSADSREEESTAIQWTLWGRQAENAAQYLGKGSHVNVVGRLRNDNYEKDGRTVYAMTFTVEEIDYLDTKAERDARAGRQAFVAEMDAHDAASSAAPAAGRTPRGARRPASA